MRITLLGFILFSIFGVFGQTFLGKKHFLSAGTAISPSIFLMKPHVDPVDYEKEFTVFPSKIEIEYGIAVNQTTCFSLSAFYRGLPNSKYTIESERSGDLIHYNYLDQYQLSTDMLNISLNLKLYTEYAPIGTYVNFSVGFNRMASIVYPSLYKTSVEHYGSTNFSSYDEYRKLESWKENANFVNIAFGLGKSNLIARNWYIDYGVQLGIFMNFYNPDASNYNPDDTPEKLKESTKVFTQKMAAANALSSNLFQFYVKFGFSK